MDSGLKGHSNFKSSLQKPSNECQMIHIMQNSFHEAQTILIFLHQGGGSQVLSGKFNFFSPTLREGFKKKKKQWNFKFFKALQRGHLTSVRGPISYRVRFMACRSFFPPGGFKGTLATIKYNLRSWAKAECTIGQGLTSPHKWPQLTQILYIIL